MTVEVESGFGGWRSHNDRIRLLLLLELLRSRRSIFGGIGSAGYIVVVVVVTAAAAAVVAAADCVSGTKRTSAPG